MKGSVKFFDREKGFGFIKGEDGVEYFFGSRDYNTGLAFAKEGEKVRFDTSTTQKGIKAINVEKE